MIIFRRTKTGWSAPEENASRTHCDKCGELLWSNPGGEIYCNGNFVGCGEPVKKEKFCRKCGSQNAKPRGPYCGPCVLSRVSRFLKHQGRIR